MVPLTIAWFLCLSDPALFSRHHPKLKAVLSDSPCFFWFPGTSIQSPRPADNLFHGVDRDTVTIFVIVAGLTICLVGSRPSETLKEKWPFRQTATNQLRDKN